MKNISYILTLPKPSVAGILTCCGYSLRESIPLFSSLEDLGFTDVDMSKMENLYCDLDLTALTFVCLTQLTKEPQTND